MFKRWSILIFAITTAAMASLAPLPVLGEPPTHPAIVFPIIAPRLSSDFGKRRHPIFHTVRHHSGVDLQAPENSHVRVVAEGTVIFAGTHGSYGKLVSVQHANGYVSLYGHLKEFRVNIGQFIPAGEIVGRVGATGAATGPHLHFEWRRNGKPLDPLKVFPNLTERAQG